MPARHTPTHRTLTRRVANGAAVGASALAITFAAAGPALAQTPAPPPPTPSAQAHAPTAATPAERAAAEVRPAVVYLKETFSGYVADETGTFFNDGNPYTLTVTCTGFGVNPDGYVATAGHCVDTTSANGIKAEFIAAAARGAAAVVPGVTVGQLVEFGSANWSVEGLAKGSPLDSTITVVTGSTDGGASGRSLPARVVDARSFEQGDVALLKVATTDLPSIELATDADVQIGTPLLSVGYPASADAVTDPSLEPSNKDGQVSSRKTVGSAPVYETSAALTPGMSGGPTVDLGGRVLGVNSFMPAGESQAFTFIAPSSGLTELMTRNGVRNKLGPDDHAFRDALGAYYAGHYTDALAGFDKLLQVAPQHAQAMQFRTAAAKARDKFGDVPVAPAPADSSSGLPFGLGAVLFWSIVGGATVLLSGLALLLIVLGRRRRQAPALPAEASDVAVGAVPPVPAFSGPSYGPSYGPSSGPAGGPSLNGRSVGTPADGAAAAPAAGATLVTDRAPAQACSGCGTESDPRIRFCGACGTGRW